MASKRPKRQRAKRPPPARPSINDLEQALRETMLSGGVKIRARPLFQNYAEVRLDHRPRSVTVDPHFGGLVENTVHELIHVAFRAKLESWGQLEEVVVVALEVAVMAHINASRARSSWWRRAVTEAVQP